MPSSWSVERPPVEVLGSATGGAVVRVEVVVVVTLLELVEPFRPLNGAAAIAAAGSASATTTDRISAGRRSDCKRGAIASNISADGP